MAGPAAEHADASDMDDTWMDETTRIPHDPAPGAPSPALKVMFTFNGNTVEGREGDTIAAALWAVGIRALRPGEAGLYCGIGHCFACRVVVDGVHDVRGCLVLIRPGMRVEPPRIPLPPLPPGAP